MTRRAWARTFFWISTIAFCASCVVLVFGRNVGAEWLMGVAIYAFLVGRLNWDIVRRGK